MRFINFTIGACILSFFLHSGSCGYIGDALQQGVRATYSIIKGIPNRIPKPNEVFEFGKNVVLGFPLELTFSAIHEFCKYAPHTIQNIHVNPVHSLFNSIGKLALIISPSTV